MWPCGRQEKVRIGKEKQTAQREAIFYSRRPEGDLKLYTCCHTGPLSREAAGGKVMDIYSEAGQSVGSIRPARLEVEAYSSQSHPLGSCEVFTLCSSTRVPENWLCFSELHKTD